MDIFFTRINRKQYLVLLILGLACFYSLAYLSKVQGCWLGIGIVSAITLIKKQSKPNRLSLYLLGYGIVLSLFVFAAGFTQDNMLVFVVYLAILALLGGFLTYKLQQPRLIYFWVLAFTILAGLQFVILEKNLLRIEMLFMGYILCAILFLDFPNQSSLVTCRQSMDAALRNLSQFTSDLFNCFNVLYADNNYIFERRLHEQKVKYMQSISQMSDQIQDKHFVAVVNRIFEELVDCSQLRWRVTDGSTFELCKKEMLALKNRLEQSFEVLIKINSTQKMLPLISMDKEIEALETNYQSVLQIAAKDPFVFLLFIASLRRLQATVYSLYHKDLDYAAA